MKRRAITLTLAVVLAALLPRSVCAEDLGIRGRPASLLRTAALVVADADPPGLVEWQHRMDSAKARRRRGIHLSIAGGVGTVLVTVLDARGGGSVKPAVLLLGVGVSAFGAYNAWRAGDQLEDLRDEGALKGYFKVRTTDGLSLRVVPGGVRLAMAVSF